MENSSEWDSTTFDYIHKNSTQELNHSASIAWVILLRISYVIGIAGNFAAIMTLCRGDKKIRNRKHVLMLMSLAINDFVALVGMMVLMNIPSFFPQIMETRWLCVLIVVLRIFGLGSVCIAVVMALERWLALTQPFLYQKHVTYYVVRKALIILWGGAAVLTCLPFVGFGIYYDESKKCCSRYRDATEPVDVAYAYVVLTFGTLLCVCLVWCNLAVIRVLCRSSSRGGDQRVLVRRISRTSSKGKPLAACSLNEPIVYNTATPDEVAFSKLMATLSVCFIICWMPQMISIFLARLLPAADRNRFKIVFRIADILMLLNYTLDPYIYVLLRGNSKPLPKCIKLIFQNRTLRKRCINQQDSLRLASQQDGLTALTTIEITPPTTTTNSLPRPKSLSTISSSESLQTSTKLNSPPLVRTPTMYKKSYLPQNWDMVDVSGSLIKDADSSNSDSIRSALNCLIKRTNDSPALV